MHIFAAVPYSSYVDYETGEIQPDYRKWLESNLEVIETAGHSVFCALRKDGYVINDSNPANALTTDIKQLKASDTLIAILGDKVSAGVQTEIGMAVAFGKRIILATPQDHVLAYFNNALVESNMAQQITLPFTPNTLTKTSIEESWD